MVDLLLQRKACPRGPGEIRGNGDGVGCTIRFLRRRGASGTRVRGQASSQSGHGLPWERLGRNVVMKVESAQVASGNPRRHPTKRKGPTHVGPWLASLTTGNQRFIDSWARRYSTVRRTFASTSIWFTTVLRAWMTVPWSRPPKAWPIDTRDMPVSWVARYMAT